ncbi:MAG: sigma-54-dependent transcriptional regulator [Planctomycetota bacterium]
MAGRELVPSAHILYVDDELPHAEAAADALRINGHVVDVCSTGKQALELLRREPYELVITDLKLGDTDGIKILKDARTIHPYIGVIVVTGYGTIESAVHAMRQGADDYLTKPVSIDALRIAVRRSLDGQALRRRVEELERHIDVKFGYEGIIGSSPRMHQIVQRLQQVAPTDVSVLILGESGTGKELIAKAIHRNSRRKEKVFVPLNCAALSEGILESELFGHEKGAFTGATYTRKGRFEHADGGTLFLDEVGDIPLETQVKLLRVLEDRQVTRIGSNEPISVDVRLLSATHRDLKQLISEGRFREDLYYRLHVVAIELPPLRERSVDIPLLVEHFISEYSRVHGKRIQGISREALRILMRHPWPGNVRELKNVLENMVVTAQTNMLGPQDIPSQVQRTEEASGNGSVLVAGTTIEELERELIRNTLAAVGGNRKEAAAMLGIGERTLYRKITEYSLR